jgi:hypothetical protein
MQHIGFWIGVAAVGIAFWSDISWSKGLTIIMLAINGAFSFN